MNEKWGTNVAQLAQSQVWCAAETGSMPWCSKGSQLSVQTLFVFIQPLCAIACIDICAHMKNPKHCQPFGRTMATKSWLRQSDFSKMAHFLSRWHVWAIPLFGHTKISLGPNLFKSRDDRDLKNFIPVALTSESARHVLKGDPQIYAHLSPNYDRFPAKGDFLPHTIVNQVV